MRVTALGLQPSALPLGDASLERDTGLEPLWTAWEALASPLRQTRDPSVVSGPVRSPPLSWVCLHRSCTIIDGVLAPPRTFASLPEAGEFSSACAWSGPAPDRRFPISPLRAPPRSRTSPPGLEGPAGGSAPRGDGTGSTSRTRLRRFWRPACSRSTRPNKKAAGSSSPAASVSPHPFGGGYLLVPPPETKPQA
jgi:hypothetical protein